MNININSFIFRDKECAQAFYESSFGFWDRFWDTIKSAIRYGEQGHSMDRGTQSLTETMIHRHETSRARLSSMKARSPRDFDDRTCERPRDEMRERSNVSDDDDDGESREEGSSKVELGRILFMSHDSQLHFVTGSRRNDEL